MPNDCSPHTFSPSPKEVASVTDAKMIMYLAGNFDYWLDVPEVEEHVEMISFVPKELILVIDEKDEQYRNKGVTFRNGLYGDDADPHFWLSPTCVKNILPEVTNCIARKFPKYRDDLFIRMRKFEVELDKLSAETKKKVSVIKDKKIILYHPSFQYYCKEFDLNYTGSFIEHPGKELSPIEMGKLYRNISKSDIKCIFGERMHEEIGVKNIAAGLKINYALLDPIGIDDGIKTYSDLIRANTDIFINALQ